MDQLDSERGEPGDRPPSLYRILKHHLYDRTDGVSNSNAALEVGLRRNLSTGLLISSNYQWSHAIDDGAVHQAL